MILSPWDDFEQRVSCEECLHVDSEPLAWPPPADRQLRMVERNANTLTAIAALEERAVESGEEDNPLMQEMLRMDAKLTALVDVVNQLLVPVESLPPRQTLRFNVVGALIPGVLLPIVALGPVSRLRYRLLDGPGPHDWTDWDPDDLALATTRKARS